MLLRFMSELVFMFVVKLFLKEIKVGMILLFYYLLLNLNNLLIVNFSLWFNFIIYLEGVLVRNRYI